MARDATRSTLGCDRCHGLECRPRGFTLRLDKCVFFRSRIKLLGHLVSRDGISASPDYVQKVSDFQTFRRVKDVQSFLGLAGYYRSYIRNYCTCW